MAVGRVGGSSPPAVSGVVVLGKQGRQLWPAPAGHQLPFSIPGYIICGYYDRENFAVNLGYYNGPHLLLSSFI